MTAESVDIEDLSIAVVHWHVNAWGGAEYLVTRLAEALGRGTVYTLGDPSPEQPNPYGDVTFEDVTHSLDYARVRRLQRSAGRVFEYAQWEDVDWREFGDPDVLVTSGATTRAVITPEDTLHVNYCHSPPRWFYDLYHDRKGSLTGVLARPLLRYLRTRDQTVDSRVDHYLANSPVIARRLWKYYKRDAEVLYPPIELNNYRNEGDDGYYLHLGRLDGEKGVSDVVEAFVGSERRLILAGGRGDAADSVLPQIDSSSQIEWRGFVNEETKYDLLARCRAVVFNGQNEDFGLVPVEANACGKAVVARDEGFPALFVEEGENGYLHDGSAAGIRSAIERLESGSLSGTPRERVQRFSFGRFSADLERTISAQYASLSLDSDDV